MSSNRKPKVERPAALKGSRPASTAGTSTMSASIKAVPRKERTAFYIGRLDNETSADSIKSYIEDLGVANCVCRKLTAKDCKVFKTSALFVMCDTAVKDKVYREDIWPEGAEIRAWMFNR